MPLLPVIKGKHPAPQARPAAGAEALVHPIYARLLRMLLQQAAIDSDRIAPKLTTRLPVHRKAAISYLERFVESLFLRPMAKLLIRRFSGSQPVPTRRARLKKPCRLSSDWAAVPRS